jgi:hypothetical protein
MRSWSLANSQRRIPVFDVDLESVEENTSHHTSDDKMQI